ncbi:hypothetical protein EH228_08765 [Erwinia endophytica]|uniref:hypothetical protein n=1 Tax=Erwinia endophytica TaxID=1563158 RepID=UPI001265F7C1|nr:hypothetical protein [Erwinia endophytica]KAB8312263.1 hypothetical protein EH228_08765 [Erwinia endophytica]
MTEVAMFEKKFYQHGTFAAWQACKQWLSDNGYSYGSTSAHSFYVGVLKGRYVIAKWHNLTQQEIRELDGYVVGNYRDGPVEVRLKSAPGVGHE